MMLDTTNLGSRRWMSIVLLHTTVIPHRCIPPAVGPLLAGIRVSYCISPYPSLPSRMVAMGILTPMIPFPPGRSDLLQLRLLLFHVATPLECPHTLVTPPNAHLPPASVILQGLHEPIPQRFPTETAGVKIEIGTVNGVAGSCKSTLAPLLIRFSLLESTHPLIVATAPVLVPRATIAPLNHLRGIFISRSQVGSILPHGLRINLL